MNDKLRQPLTLLLVNFLGMFFVGLVSGSFSTALSLAFSYTLFLFAPSMIFLNLLRSLSPLEVFASAHLFSLGLGMILILGDIVIGIPINSITTKGLSLVAIIVGIVLLVRDKRQEHPAEHGKAAPL